ncbi:MAG TPA: helix-turn-helix domain-containing protein [Steroidobacteraceae bacterium]|nr:helix-turn-helix domain-containing protein [Steroidobacteraceae bacterium]
MAAKSIKSRVKIRRSDRRRDRTRQALLSAGRALFAARDVDGVSVDEIVAAAEVAKGSFYNHFSDKDVFAREIAAAVRRQAEQLVNAANARIEDPAIHLARAMCVFVRFAIEHRDSARVLWKLNSGATMVDAPINRDLREVVQMGIKNDRFKHVDLETGVLLVMGVIVIALRHVLEERLVTPPVTVAINMAAGLLRTLGIPPVQARDLAQAAAQELLIAD